MRAATRPSGDRRPFVIVEPLNAVSTERGMLHLPWALGARLRERLSRDRRLVVASEGSVERGLLEAGGNTDSAATLLGAQWIIRGSSVAVMGATEISLELRRRGTVRPVWKQTFRTSQATIAGIEELTALATVGLMLGPTFFPPPRAAGSSQRAEADALLARAEYLLRDLGVTAADSARSMLETAFARDTGSALVATRLGQAYLQLVDRAGVAPSIDREGAFRRVEQLAAYALTLDSTRADAWTLRAVSARLRDTPRLDAALRAHARAAALAPRDAEAAHELGVTLMQLGDDARAAVELARALALEPERAATLAALAEIELRAGRWNQSCAYSNASIAANSFQPRVYALRARARLRMGEARDAYADAEMSSRLSNEPWTEALRVQVEMGAGNVEMARSLGKALAQKFLAAGKTLSVRDATTLGLAFMSVGDTRHALDALTRARPVGRSLYTALRDTAFDRLRGDSVFRTIAAPVSAAAVRRK